MSSATASPAIPETGTVTVPQTVTPSSATKAPSPNTGPFIVWAAAIALIGVTITAFIQFRVGRRTVAAADKSAEAAQTQAENTRLQAENAQLSATAAQKSAEAARDAVETSNRGIVDLETRSRREEVLRNMRWAAELAVSSDGNRAKLGVAQLNALGESDMLDATQQLFIDAALAAVVTEPVGALDESGPDVQAVLVPGQTRVSLDPSGATPGTAGVNSGPSTEDEGDVDG